MEVKGGARRPRWDPGASARRAHHRPASPALAGRWSRSARGAARARCPSNTGHEGRATEGGERGEVHGRPPALRPGSGRGRRSALVPLFLSFFSPLSPTAATRLRARPGPGLGPRQPAALARNHNLRPAPDGAERAASRVRTTRLAPPELLAGCSKSPPPATATAGRPEVSSPRYTTLACLRTWAHSKPIKSTTLSGGSLGSCVDEERS